MAAVGVGGGRGRALITLITESADDDDLLSFFIIIAYIQREQS